MIIALYAPFTRREDTEMPLRFGLSFPLKPYFYHRKQNSDNGGYVFPCRLGEIGF